MSYTNFPARPPRSPQRDSAEQRRGSRVRFSEQVESFPTPLGSPTDGMVDDQVQVPQPSGLGSSQTQWPTPDYSEPQAVHRARSQAQWHIPDYSEPQEGRYLRPQSTAEVSPLSATDGPGSRGSASSSSSGRSSMTLTSDGPYAIQPPQTAYGGSSYPTKSSAAMSPGRQDDQGRWADSNDPEPCRLGTREDRHRGVLSNIIDLYANENQADDDVVEPRMDPGSKGLDAQDSASTERGEQARKEIYKRLNRLMSQDSTDSRASKNWLRRTDSAASDASQVLDPDDPSVTGARKKQLDDPEDVEKACLKQMSYKARRKYQQRIRIEFNITSMLNRREFLMRLAKALMTFGAPSHRIESQLLSAARILEVDGEFIHIPGIIICSFGDQETKTTEMHFIKCGGRLSLGSLHEVHQIYRQVVHDEISARRATEKLEALIVAKPLYGSFTRCILAFLLSALICPLAFGGSFLDLWIAGLGASFLCLMQIFVASKSQLYANVFEISVTIIISFAARGLSSIRSQIFCYTAISSAGIVGILPGYLILSSSLELASKNIVCGSVKMVYALIYTLFLGFGLQIGSDLYLLFDPRARNELTALAARMQNVATITGTFVSDNGTFANITRGTDLTGTFSFTTGSPLEQEHILNGCYRAPDSPWFLSPFPFWTQFIIVPIFSITSSLLNLQPFRSVELIVMVVISCVSYAANKVANHFIFNRSDVVSAIGAFAVGLLGNIYSRKMGGTAFTSMVTGVLFLVPSGLSQAGGITAQGNGIDIGGAMIAVTIGITVGLFMSQALVYMFGSRKNAAIFSF